MEGIVESLRLAHQSLITNSKISEQTLRNQGDAITNLEIQHSKLSQKNDEIEKKYQEQQKLATILFIHRTPRKSRKKYSPHLLLKIKKANAKLKKSLNRNPWYNQNYP